MKAWLGAALLAVASLLAGAAWFAAPVAERVAAEPGAVPRPPARVPVPAAAPAKPQIAPVSAARQRPTEPAPIARLNAEEAQTLMQLLAEQGDPRSPALHPSRSRQSASAAELADPALYAQFEARQAREQILAYTGGVQQIPVIRERIEQAAQSGERNAEELDEARAALEQLEQLQSRLQREAPHLLPPSP